MEDKRSLDNASENLCQTDRKVAKERLQFSSTLSTYLTILGYSVGISDIWRFPFLAYRNGGGAFLIPFVVMTIVCAIPLFFVEYSVGKFSGRGVYQVWDISPIFRGIGMSLPVMYIMYLTGTTIFRSWMIQLLVDAFRNPLPWQHCDNAWNTHACKPFAMTTLNETSSNMTSHVLTNRSKANFSPSIQKSITPTEEYWTNNLLQLSSGMSDLSPVLWKYFLFVVIVRIITFLCLLKSIKSIEKVMYVTTILPFLLTLAIFINSLTLPGAKDGIYYFFYPQFSQLLKPKVWIEAAVMNFYTMGFGWGPNIVMGSHARFKDNTLRTALVIPLVDSFSAMFGGLVCFSVLGNMAHVYNVHVKDVIEAGLSTGIVAYITALTSLPLPQVWNVCLVVALVINGIDGQLISLELVIQVIGDVIRRVSKGSRIKILVIVSVFMCVGAIPACTGAGGYIFLWVDWYAGSWPGIIIGFLEVTVICWIYGLDRFSEDTKLMIGRDIPAILRVTLAFVSPVIVLILLCMGVIQYQPPKYGSYTYPLLARIGGWGSVVVLLLPIPITAYLTVRRSKGSLFKKLKANLQPANSWGPIEENVQEDYTEMKQKYKQRCFKDLLYFNVFGRYPGDSAMHSGCSKELKHLDSLKA